MQILHSTRNVTDLDAWTRIHSFITCHVKCHVTFLQTRLMIQLSLWLSSAVFVWCCDAVLENFLAAWLLISKCCSWYPQDSNTDGTRPGASDINPLVSDLELHYSFFYYCSIRLPELGMEGKGRRSWQRYRLEWQRVKLSATGKRNREWRETGTGPVGILRSQDF